MSDVQTASEPVGSLSIFEVEQGADTVVMLTDPARRFFINRSIGDTEINQVEWRGMELSGLASTLRFCPAEIPEVLSHTLVSDQGLDSVGGTEMDRWPRGCRWIRTN